MADQKTTQLLTLASPNGNDLIIIIDDPLGTPQTKKITLNNLLSAIPANTVISGTLTVSGNTTINGSNAVVSSNTTFTSAKGPKINAGFVTLGTPTTVSSNNTTTVLGSGGLQGSLFWDDNFLYVGTSNTSIKRVALSTF